MWSTHGTECMSLCYFIYICRHANPWPALKGQHIGCVCGARLKEEVVNFIPCDVHQIEINMAAIRKLWKQGYVDVYAWGYSFYWNKWPINQILYEVKGAVDAKTYEHGSHFALFNFDEAIIDLPISFNDTSLGKSCNCTKRLWRIPNGYGWL